MIVIHLYSPMLVSLSKNNLAGKQGASIMMVLYFSLYSGFLHPTTFTLVDSSWSIMRRLLVQPLYVLFFTF